MQLATRENVYRTRNYRCASILKTAYSSLVLVALMALEVNVPIHGQNLSPDAVRQYIAAQAGGIIKLTVPATDADIPVPAPVAGSGNTPYRYETTEAKRYLGKQLFHDPVRTVRINENQGQPVDLPAGTAFGGELQASDPDIQNIANATIQTGSCGSCHFAESAGKAGQQINFNVGAEGRGYTDEKGTFFARRRARTDILPALRTEPIFNGDMLVDFLPTLTDIWQDPATDNELVTTPAFYYHPPTPTVLDATGRLDALDSVGRNSMNMIGFAFNNRLLFGGFGGEPPATIGSLNPYDDPAQEDITLELQDAHRMLNFQAAELLKFPAFVKLFRDAYPVEAAQADAQNDQTLLVNDQTVFRALATFLRTIVTRNTPFDKFLAGDDRALTPQQLSGAKLFFTSATAGGAGCFTCHSGPNLNKQYNDPDVAGIGTFIDENFINVGIGDHPVRALQALASGTLDTSKLGPDGFPYHAVDTGREEVTHDPNDAFRFRVLTLRQAKDAKNFFHNGSLTSVRDAVEYFNAGVPQDPTAGAAATLSPRFTNPRGPGFPNGLGLTKGQVDDLTDFIENGLYDPAHVIYDPNSTTPSLSLNVRDLTYSKYRPDLAALGAQDGFVISGKAFDNNDPLTRRDEGLEFMDVTNKLGVQLTRDISSQREVDTYKITNISTATDVSGIVDTNLLIIAQELPNGVQLENASAISSSGNPYLRVFLPKGALNPGQSIVRQLIFDKRQPSSKPVSYTLDFLSGQGKP
jgi:Di-haem cytochrome c peroxidase